jgi:hypothetical protein
VPNILYGRSGIDTFARVLVDVFRKGRNPNANHNLATVQAEITIDVAPHCRPLSLRIDIPHQKRKTKGDIP